MHAIGRNHLVIAHNLDRLAALDWAVVHGVRRVARLLATDHGRAEPDAARAVEHEIIDAAERGASDAAIASALVAHHARFALGHAVLKRDRHDALLGALATVKRAVLGKKHAIHSLRLFHRNRRALRIDAQQAIAGNVGEVHDSVGRAGGAIGEVVAVGPLIDVSSLGNDAGDVFASGAIDDRPFDGKCGGWFLIRLLIGLLFRLRRLRRLRLLCVDGVGCEQDGGCEQDASDAEIEGAHGVPSSDD